MTIPSRPAALILCGGQSRRMGRPKAWLPFGSETLLQRVVGLLGAVACPIAVVASPEQDLPPLREEVQLVRDPIAHLGPLQGLATGLAALPESVDLVYASATDVPFLRVAWVERLLELIGDDDLALPQIDGYFHPLAALYRRAPVLEAARRLLDSGRLRPVFLTETLKTRVVAASEMTAADPGLQTLRNLNTPEDYERALREIEEDPGREP